MGMDKKRKNEELQSRREFFKKAAKGTLPILGAIVLASNPLLTKAATHEGSVEMGCGKGNCSGTCDGSCRHTCESTCSGTCDGSCRHTCKSTCSGTCDGSSKK